MSESEILLRVLATHDELTSMGTWAVTRDSAGMYITFHDSGGTLAGRATLTFEAVTVEIPEIG